MNADRQILSRTLFHASRDGYGYASLNKNRQADADEIPGILCLRDNLVIARNALAPIYGKLAVQCN